MTVDELHRHRALTNGGGASLGRARADVTSGEDARNTGLERVLGSRSSAREDEAVIVACDRVVEPIGARLGAEEEKQERERRGRAGRVGGWLGRAPPPLRGGGLTSVARPGGARPAGAPP